MCDYSMNSGMYDPSCEYNNLLLPYARTLKVAGLLDSTYL
jgi:hypothetical protein